MTTQPTTDLEMALVDVLNELVTARDTAVDGRARAADADYNYAATVDFMHGAVVAYDHAIGKIEGLIAQHSTLEAQRQQGEEDARTNEMEMWGPQGRPAMPRGGDGKR